MRKAATISECGKFRTLLSRIWDDDLPLIGFIGLNPSTADAEVDDHTIRKEMGFAQRRGYGGIIKCNRYAYRATKPKDLWQAAKYGVFIGGIGNLAADMREHLKNCDIVVAAWGRHGLQGQDTFVHAYNAPLHCFGVNSDMTPIHPLMLPYTTQIIEFWRPNA